ncbi:hypothetical protein OAK19_03545, partial [Aureispira]|nr:hypothetical protein [Aureispira sp.]
NKKNAFWKFFNYNDKTSKKKAKLLMGLSAMFFVLMSGLIVATVAIIKNSIGYSAIFGILTIILAAACLVWCVIFLIKSLVYYSKTKKGYIEKVERKKIEKQDKQRKKNQFRASKEGKLLAGIILTIAGTLVLGVAIAFLLSMIAYYSPIPGIIALGIAFILGALLLLFLGIWSLILAKKAPSIKD